MARIGSIPADDNGCGRSYLSQGRITKSWLQSNVEADWVMIGAEFTGLSAARQLALNFSNAHWILLEVQQVQYAATGRNSGFMSDLPHDIGAADYIGELNNANMHLKLRISTQNIIKKQMSEYRIDCQLESAGKYQAAVEKFGFAVRPAYKNRLEKSGQYGEIIIERDIPAYLRTHFYSCLLDVFTYANMTKVLTGKEQQTLGETKRGALYLRILLVARLIFYFHRPVHMLILQNRFYH